MILLTGGSGYVGGRLIPLLEERGGAGLRCLARDPARLRPRVRPTTEVVAGDVLDPGSLAGALREPRPMVASPEGRRSPRDLSTRPR